MPRLSAEARAGAAWRAGGEPPSAPAHLNCEARTIWDEIVHDRPADFFQAGGLVLLESFCATSAELRKVAVALQEHDPGSATHQRLITTTTQLARVQASLGSKLRLAVSARVRADSGMLSERRSRLPRYDC
jgi:phage terminase small subunit